MEGLRKEANEKKIGRALFQKARDNGSFTRFLDLLRTEATEYIPISDARIAELTELAQKVGARIHILRCVRVKQDRSWQEAVTLAGPHTPSHYNVWKADDLYKYVSAKDVEIDIVLLNYSQVNGNWDKALAWGKEARVKNTNPREVFTVGEQNPALHSTLGQNPIYVVASTECTFEGSRNTCYVLWDLSNRRSGLAKVSDFGRVNGDWFAFRE